MATYESRRYNTPVPDVTKVADGSVNNTEFQHLDGVTSDIQTQMNARLPLAGGTVTGNVIFNDNASVYVGTGQDARIFHDGSNTTIKNDTGALKVLANTLQLKNNADNETLATFANGGAASLRFNNSTKLETTNTGINVTGTVDGSLFNGNGSDLTFLNASNLSSGTVPVARLPGSLGKVLQVVSTNTTSVFQTNSSSYVDVTGMSVSITPAATSSKIYVLIDYNADTFNNNTIYGLRLTRNGTAIGGGAQANQVINLQANNMEVGGFNYYDSPSSTSALTYKLQVRTLTHSGTNNGTIIFNQTQENANNKWASNITAIEVGA